MLNILKKQRERKIRRFLEPPLIPYDSAYAEKLLRKGIDPDLKTKYEEPILIYALQLNNFDLAKMLIMHGINLDLDNQYNETALTRLIKTHYWTNEHHAIFELLLSKSEKIVDISLKKSNLMLESSKNGLLPPLKYFINHGIDINSQDKKGNSPLMLAAKNGHLTIVNELIRTNANTEITNQDEDTAFTLASKYGHFAVAHALYDVDTSHSIDTLKILIVTEFNNLVKNYEDLNKQNDQYFVLGEKLDQRVIQPYNAIINCINTLNVLTDKPADLNTYNYTRPTFISSSHFSADGQYVNNDAGIEKQYALGNKKIVDDFSQAVNLINDLNQYLFSKNIFSR